MKNELAQLMEENLHLVWTERNPHTRLVEIGKIYAADSQLFHVGDKVQGHAAINDSVSNTLNNLPEEFEFSLLKPIIINNNVGRLVWGVGAKGQQPVATGMDVAVFENEKIKSLYVFLD